MLQAVEESDLGWCHEEENLMIGMGGVGRGVGGPC